MSENRTYIHLVSIAALIIILAAARTAQQIVVPFLLAGFISIIAASPVAWLRKQRVSAGLALAIVLVSMIGLLFGMVLIMTSPIESFSQALPTYLNSLKGVNEKFVQWLSIVGIDVPEAGFKRALDPGTAMHLVNSIFNSLSELFSYTFLITLTVIFMMLEASVFSEKISLIRDDPGRTMTKIAGFLENTQRYMAIKAFTSIITGIIIGISMALVGVDYALLWGFLAFVLNFIPNIGSIIAGGLAVLMTLLQLGIGPAIIVAIIFLAVNMVIGNIIEPRIMGRGVGLSTLVVFLSLIFWGWMFGPIGMLLSVPLTMLVKFAAEANEDTRWIAILLSSSTTEYVEQTNINAELSGQEPKGSDSIEN